MCPAQEPQGSDAGEARTHGPRSRVQHSTTEQLRSHIHCCDFTIYTRMLRLCFEHGVCVSYPPAQIQVFIGLHLCLLCVCACVYDVCVY